MNDKVEFERLKKSLDEIRVKKIANEREQERSRQSLESVRESIKKLYGIEPDDMGALLETLKKEIDEKKALLEKKINDAREILK